MLGCIPVGTLGKELEFIGVPDVLDETTREKYDESTTTVETNIESSKSSDNRMAKIDMQEVKGERTSFTKCKLSMLTTYW
jgi:hypothetical protein